MPDANVRRWAWAARSPVRTGDRTQVDNLCYVGTHSYVGTQVDNLCYMGTQVDNLCYMGTQVENLCYEEAWATGGPSGHAVDDRQCR
jgi:hypothetical protein